MVQILTLSLTYTLLTVLFNIPENPIFNFRAGGGASFVGEIHSDYLHLGSEEVGTDQVNLTGNGKRNVGIVPPESQPLELSLCSSKFGGCTKNLVESGRRDKKKYCKLGLLYFSCT